MIQTLLALVLLAAPALTAAPPRAPRPFTLGPSVEGLTEYRLPNGLRVLLVPDASQPTTTVNLTVFVGSRHEGYGEKGMAHLFEHMLFKRTKRFKSIKDELTRLGGFANGSTWYDRTNYFEIFPADDAKLRRALELEAERLRRAIISRDELATEMGVVKNELDMGENDPQNVLIERVLSTAFLWHNYGDSTIGPASDVEGVPNERLLRWYETYYQPDNALLIVAGKFDPQRALKHIAATFGRIPRPRRQLPATYTREPAQDGERAVTVRRVGGTPLLLAAYHVPAGTDPDYAAIDVLERILGEAPAGRLHKALVETKLAARVSCTNYQLREPGVFYCQAELQAKDPVAPVRDGMLAVLEGLAQKPVTPEEVERARTSLLKQIELLLNSSERVGIVLSEFAAMGDWRMLFVHRDRIEKVTVEDVMRVAGRYLQSANRTQGEYVPSEQPARAEIPAVVDLGPVLAGYAGKQALVAGEVFEATPGNIEARTARSSLPGGLKLALLSKKTRGETVRALLRLRYGTEKSLTGKGAVGDLAAQMLLRGTKTRTRQQIKDQLDKLKAEVEVNAHGQGLDVTIEVRRPELAATLELVAECLKAPTFDPRELEELRREVLAGLQQQQDDPMQVALTGLGRLVAKYPKGHPYDTPTFQEQIAETQAVTLEAVKAFHAAFYGAQDGLLAVVGDFEPQALQAQLVALLGGWKAPEAYQRIPAPLQAHAVEDLIVPIKDKPMACLVAAVTFALRDDQPDYPALELANYLLGGGFMNGRVTKRLREKEGFSYGAGTFLNASAWEERGFLGGYAIFGTANTAEVERAFREELEKAVAGGFTAEELKLGREGLLKEREQTRAMDDALARDLVGQLELGRTMAFEAAIDARLAALGLEEIAAALKKYVDPGRLSVLKAGDLAAPAAEP
ncbi:MAG TPA: pitrilysin family protein [Myxococcota bacterium]|nr:pitrilysin family protein [Myxococcota bacterium]HRY97025.1 pitrilysin family protein [Myxococcota bacterium]HSA23143.1 pitrilysin family protein [Myxococcota bacterium]